MTVNYQVDQSLRAPADSYSPDHVVISDTWNMKPHRAKAKRGCPTIFLEFITFLEQLERETSTSVKTIHIGLDNLRMHKGKQVQAWLAKRPSFKFHHPPVHCSWMILNCWERY
jgi:DDE superfamily endonuclease